MANALWENLTLGIAALITNKVRSFLTMLGIIIGVFSIILLIGMGQGVKKDVTKEITELGSNVLFVLPGKVATDSGAYNPTASLGASTLTEDDLAAIRSLPEITDISVLSLLTGVPETEGKKAFSSLNLAVQPSYFDIVTTAKLKTGRLFTPADDAEQAKVVVIGAGPRQELFPELSAEQTIGKTVRFAGETYTIVGTTASSQSSSLFGGNNFMSAFFLPYSTAKALIANTQIFRIIVKADESADMKAVAESIRTAVLMQHKGSDDFTVFRQEDILDVVQNILTILTAAVSGIGAISLLVGGIGIMNIMLVSVTERTKEIGLRKAVGASNGNILFQFLTEAIVLSITGGAIGVLGAYAVGKLVESKAGFTVVVDLTSIGIAVAFSLIIGLIFGVAPAIRAARLNPIQALRYE